MLHYGPLCHCLQDVSLVEGTLKAHRVQCDSVRDTRGVPGISDLSPEVHVHCVGLLCRDLGIVRGLERLHLHLLLGTVLRRHR